MTSLSDLSTVQWLMAIVAATALGMSKSGIAGASIVGILLMTSIFPARASTGIILPMLIAADFMACGAYWKNAKWRHVFRLLPPAVVGVVLGSLLMQVIPGDQYRHVIGWIILVMVILQALKLRYRDFSPPLFHQWPFAVTMAILAGATTMMANAAGPVMALYLTVVDLPKVEFVATGAFFFLVINLVKAPFSWSQGLITGQTLLFNAMMIPAIAAGVWVGKWIVVRLSQRVFEILIVAFSAIAAIRLIWP
ncbi:MAG TPA: sulfite exporter TauE/SafE family protein [Chthoniobacterales bacterium]